ncbi:UDP-glucose/GDP-mannose dehydrogenase family protein [Patescibacteria group bacterium]|nr:UDP-glucose/GDP-mannose dehydrogenase family protein [Patescibacteria group bacterium]MBU1906863.1 UDP-glucose/GDP-mannose dehydrogenase family protein [Patescibacteria group bacterium]
MDIAIIGTGYVGLVSGACLASFGHNVVCVDSDERKIDKLLQGKIPFYEPGLAELVAEGVANVKLSFTSSIKQGVQDASFIFICVGTPPLGSGKVDLSYVEQVAKDIGTHIDHNAYVIDKSTVPVGTSRMVKTIIDQAIEDAGRDTTLVSVVVASNPEFLREGSAINDFMKPDRIVVGVDELWAGDLIMELYKPIECPKLVMSPESAELAKYAANAFLATKISFINEIANVAEQNGADVREVAKAIGLDKRIGESFLKAGIGYGGSCFPKDVSALYQLAGSDGYDFRLLGSVIEVNNRQRERFVSKLRSLIGDLNGKRIAVWGLAFKNGTDDVRESAAIDVISKCYADGADIIAYDPQATENAKQIFQDRIEYASSAFNAAYNSDVVLVLTEWPEFRAVNFEQVKEGMNSPVIIDGKNLLADLELSDQGFEYYGVGIPTD